MEGAIMSRMNDMSLQLESLVDHAGLESILALLRDMCYAKANHIAVEWQDVALAKQWIAYGIHINSAACAVQIGERRC
jgi:hypothetical protein